MNHLECSQSEITNLEDKTEVTNFSFKIKQKIDMISADRQKYKYINPHECSQTDSSFKIQRIENVYNSEHKSENMNPPICSQINENNSASENINPPEYSQSNSNLEILQNIKEEPLDNDVKAKADPIECSTTSGYSNHKKFFIKIVDEINLLNSRALAEKKKALQDLSKQVNYQEGNQGIFQSSILDNFLQNSPKLQINYDVFSNLLGDGHNSSIFPKIKPKIKDPDEEDRINKISSIDFIKNMLGDITTRKFIWVKDRPIMIEHESKKSKQSSYNKRSDNNSVDNSREETVKLDRKEHD